MDGKPQYAVHGADLQLLEITLKPGESICAETGAMTYLDNDIDMTTSSAGGAIKSLKRALSGESLFLSTFTNIGQVERTVAFSAPFPGKIIPLVLVDDEYFYSQRGAFLCAQSSIELEIALTKRFGTGLFGGEGFVLQKISGNGVAFLHAGGTVIQKTLLKEDLLKVDTGCIVAFSSTIDYDIQFVRGFRNAIFGGEGLFLATLQGPGTVYLQSLPFSRLADRIRAVTQSSID